MRVFSRHKKLVFVVLIILVAGAATWRLWPKDSAGKTNNSSKKSSQTTQPEPNRIRLIATGDFIYHDAINLRAKKSDGSYDYLQFMSAMRPFFEKADIKFCNQATPIGGAQYGITGYPVFNAPFEAIRDMARLGCNVINTGTNHTNDKGQKVINSELDEWDKQQGILAVAGANRSSAEQQKVHYFTVKGVKFAFMSYSTYSNTPNPNSYSLNRFSEPLVTNQMVEARANADIVVVSMRWGTEYSDNINAEQTRDAQKLANLGADIVLGHGTHTLQPVKRLTGKDGRETLVWYSLGNFLNAQEEVEGLNNCLAIIDIDPGTKKMTGSSCLPIYMHYEWNAAQKAHDDLLARHNFQLVPLDQAADLLAKSQLNTTVQAQTDRIRSVVNQFTQIPVITSAQY
jgi:poly-gamma-glutamate synthesis protein (capsule biosynthesis protein)